MPVVDDTQGTKDVSAKRKWNRFPGHRRARAGDSASEKSKGELSREAADAVTEFMKKKGAITKCPDAFAYGVKEPQLLMV